MAAGDLGRVSGSRCRSSCGGDVPPGACPVPCGPSTRDGRTGSSAVPVGAERFLWRTTGAARRGLQVPPAPVRRVLVCSCSGSAAERARPRAGCVPARLGRHPGEKPHRQNCSFGGKTIICFFIYQHADNHTLMPCVTSSIMERSFNFCCEYCWSCPFLVLRV